MADVPLTPAQREELKKLRVRKAYRDLFGAEDKLRSDTQRIVWNDLRIAGYIHTPVFVRDEAGALCPMRAAYADGRRSIALMIEANVTTAEILEQQPQQR